MLTTVLFLQLQLKLEIVSVYDRVRSACQDLKHRIHRTDIPMKPDITVHQVKVSLKIDQLSILSI